MPRRDDIHKILVLGAGPIVIGQACEFDYSGTQAVKALKALGYQVALINSNPATIMTDPDLADSTYIEPLTPAFVEKVIERERPDALLPTVGGQTALNLAVELSELGILKKWGVELIGVNVEAVRIAEDREIFAQAMKKADLPVPFGGFATTVPEGEEVARKVGFPAIIRPSFTLGGEGGGIAYNMAELREIVDQGLDLSPTHKVLIERSVIGWKEFELEVMRDHADNVVVICSIENIDPMGVHTGDSMTVAPAMTLTDREYQRLRDWALKVIRVVGVETGGSNVQFAVNPENGEVLVIEMNPRVSRSSALASKATGFPIAKIAALLAVGLSLDEIPNDITQKTPASFEPTLDYVVVKIPRWNFEKFPKTPPELTTSMKSVGEVMAIGGTFKEAFQKALRSLELGISGMDPAGGRLELSDGPLRPLLVTPRADRIFYIREALIRGLGVGEIAELTGVDPWFLDQMRQLLTLESELEGIPLDQLPAPLLRRAKRWGFSDRQLARLSGSPEGEVRRRRKALGVKPIYHRVDTCAAEFEAHTPYMYSSWGDETEAQTSTGRKVLILGGGPIRIGQGIEFDACCCHAVRALQEVGVTALMMNCNPETVSTDYDTADRLYFEPLTLEDVLNLVDIEQPEGVIIQFGGQTPLKLALPLRAAGVSILGTSPMDIDLAEDRERFGALVAELGIAQPRHGLARSEEEAVRIAQDLGYPVLLRPSYVLGGRGMVVVEEEGPLRHWMRGAVQVSEDRPVLVDSYLKGAIEVDVDAVADGERIIICGMLEHIEEAGVHSGDSAGVLPPHTLSPKIIDALRTHTHALAKALNVRGLINVQFAIRDDRVFVLEANPRASRTIPFISKATGIAWASVAAKIMVGHSLASQGITQEVEFSRWWVKMVVLPFDRFPQDDTLLGPEMRSTGEVMGHASDLGSAVAKGQMAVGLPYPTEGAVLVTVRESDKDAVIPICRELEALGLALMATRGTAASLRRAGLSVATVHKRREGRPNVEDHIRNGSVQMVINTSGRGGEHSSAVQMRRVGIRMRVLTLTTLEAARAAVWGIRALKSVPQTVTPLQSC